MLNDVLHFTYFHFQLKLILILINWKSVNWSHLGEQQGSGRMYIASRHTLHIPVNTSSSATCFIKSHWIERILSTGQMTGK